VQRGSDREVRHVDFVHRDDLGTDGHRALKVLARRPLRRGALPLARGTVVHDAVAKDGRERVFGLHVTSASSHHDGEFAFVVKSVAEGRLDEVVVGPDVAATAAHERLGPRGHGASTLDGVIGVVDTQTENPRGVRRRGSEVGTVVLFANAAGRLSSRVERGGTAASYTVDAHQGVVTGNFGEVHVPFATTNVEPQS